MHPRDVRAAHIVETRTEAQWSPRGSRMRQVRPVDAAVLDFDDDVKAAWDEDDTCGCGCGCVLCRGCGRKGLCMCPAEIAKRGRTSWLSPSERAILDAAAPAPSPVEEARGTTTLKEKLEAIAAKKRAMAAARPVFEVGQRVRVVGEAMHGAEGVVERDDGDGYAVRVRVGGAICGFSREYIAPVSPAPSLAGDGGWRAGDRVAFEDDDGQRVIRTITAFDEENTIVRFDSGTWSFTKNLDDMERLPRETFVSRRSPQQEGGK